MEFFEKKTEEKLGDLMKEQFEFSSSFERGSIFEYVKKYEKGNVSVLNSNNVIAIIGKTDRAKEFLFNYYNASNSESLNLNPKKTKNGRVYVSPNYLEFISKFAEILTYETGEGIEIESRKDFPLEIENKDFKIYLAPRGDN